MTESSTEKSANNSKKIKKIIKKSLEALSVLLLIFLVALIGVVIVQKVKGERTQLFGYTIAKILTESMEPAIMTDDVILSRVYNQGDSLEKDMVVTFNAPEDNKLKGYTITHRIIAVEVVDGKTLLTTKGDNAPSYKTETIEVSDVVSVYVKTLPILTFFFKLITNIWGFLGIIVLPLCVILIIQIINIAKLSMKKKEAKEEPTEPEKIEFTEEEIKEFIAKNNEAKEENENKSE